MHLGNGAITPECAILGFGAAAAGLGYGWLASRKTPQPVSLTQAAALSGLVFAAQMINVPVMATSSAHFVGGVLLAELLGPSLGAVAMSVVLLIQALLLGDGGLAALGVNIVNMALVPAGLVAAGRRCTQNRWLVVGGASALSIALAVLLIAGEVAIGRSGEELAAWSNFVAAMGTTHAVVFPLEALATLALVVAWRKLEVADLRSNWALPVATTILAVVMAGLAWNLSSSLPDGYESAAAASQMGQLLAEDSATVAALGQFNGWLHNGQEQFTSATSAAIPSEMLLAIVATLATASVICAVLRLWRTGEPQATAV
jgi:cobalt/nickel transport system permease protein